ncbi:MAG: DUF4258 domain-containing protein, partial [Armatimonadetes bacterium]|nr:DUF4258 domain-containing protein [Armatimonadota bacterium]
LAGATNEDFSRREFNGNLAAKGFAQADVAGEIGGFVLESAPGSGLLMAGYGRDGRGRPISDCDRVLSGLSDLPLIGAAGKAARGGKKFFGAGHEAFRIGDDVSPRSPVGVRGHRERAIPAGQNLPGEVFGRRYTGHAFDQMQARGIYPSAVEEAINQGESVPGRAGRTVFWDKSNGMAVVLEMDGTVVTVYWKTK